jgi:hypothetical protein
MKKNLKVSFVVALLFISPLRAITVSEALEAFESQTAGGASNQNVVRAEGKVTFSECYGWGEEQRVKIFFDSNPELRELEVSDSSLESVSLFDQLGDKRFDAMHFKRVFFVEDACAPLPNTFSSSSVEAGSAETTLAFFLRSIIAAPAPVTISKAMQVVKQKLIDKFTGSVVGSFFINMRASPDDRDDALLEAQTENFKVYFFNDLCGADYLTLHFQQCKGWGENGEGELKLFMTLFSDVRFHVFFENCSLESLNLDVPRMCSLRGAGLVVDGTPLPSRFVVGFTSGWPGAKEISEALSDRKRIAQV